MSRQPGYIVELVTLAVLVAVPFVLPQLGINQTTINRILIWGLVGVGFDLLFGFTGLLSFGQSAFFGTGGMVAAYLLTMTGFHNVVGALIIGTLGTAVIGYLVGLVALRSTGIYFAMITVAIAEVFFFLEFNPLSAFTGGENGLPGVPSPSLGLGFTTIHFKSHAEQYAFFAFWFFIGLVIALRIVRSPVGAIMRAIRDNSNRVEALGHNTHSYKLLIFVIAAMYAGFGGGLLGLVQGFMPPDAFMFETSGEIIMMAAIGGIGTLFGPVLGAAAWLLLSDLFQTTWHLGSSWKLLLGLIFVLLVCFLRRGLAGVLLDAIRFSRRKHGDSATAPEPASHVNREALAAEVAAASAQAPAAPRKQGAILQTRGVTKQYGGLVANSDINFRVEYGELRGIIGPNGAGKSTFFKMLTCEVHPTSGTIEFEGRDITGMGVADACRLGLTKSYQINQLFDHMTVRENLTIAVLGRLRGKFKMDFLKGMHRVRKLDEEVARTAALVHLTHRLDADVAELAYGEKRRLEVGLALATNPTLLLLDEPLAGMSHEERVETVALLKSIGRDRTMVIIDHDMDSLFSLVEKVTVLQEGKILVEGTPEEIKSNPLVQEAYLGGMEEGAA